MNNGTMRIPVKKIIRKKILIHIAIAIGIIVVAALSGAITGRLILDHII